MHRRISSLAAVFAFVLMLALVGCGQQQTQAPQEEAPSQPGATQTEEQDSTTQAAAQFLTSDRCSACHDNIQAADGDGSHVDAWSPSVHSKAAQDPYYLATVRAEILTDLLPAEDIQKTCAPCHLGMADTSAAAAGASQEFLDEAAQEGHDLNSLFLEGVSCLVCHQMQDENTTIMAGEFEAPFKITEPGSELRALYGPYGIADDMRGIMEGSIGFTTHEWTGDSSSEVCAPCHTLYTPTFNTDGTASGMFLPEQTPYYELKASDHADESCVSCHMPQVGAGKLALQSKEDVEQLHSHALLGPNSFMLEMLGDDSGKLDDRVAASKAFMETAATVDATLSGKELIVDVTSETGHKFPTAFPSRRAWIHVTAKDASGAVIFESGGYDDRTGRINGADKDELSVEPHHDVISDPNNVQIYESFLGTSEGEPTTTLLYGTHYVKDNRLLPAGFDAAKLDIDEKDVAPVGDAATDENFQPGSDRVTYTLPEGVASVDVQVVYQSISYHWGQHLATDESAEHTAFKEMFEGTDNTPRVVATTSVSQ